MAKAIPIIGTIGGAVVAPVIGGLVGGGILGSLIGGLAGSVVSVGVSYLGQQVFGKSSNLQSSASSFTADVAGGGRTQMVRQPITSQKIIYGRTLVSGPIVFIHSRPIDSSSSKLDILHLVVVLAGHEVAAIGDIQFNDAVVAFDGSNNANAAPYFHDGVSYASIYKHLGANNQVADQVLIDNTGGKWTSAHRLRGLAYIHAMLRWDDTAYSGGLPNISAVVSGREVYDLRNETTAWSDNSALCVMDYMSADFGFSATLDEIDLDSFSAAANICDETVDTITGTEKRYTCNGVVDLASTPQDNLQNMLTSCAGKAAYTGGKWRLRVGAYTPPIYSLGPNHVRDAVVLRPHRSRQNLVNTMTGAFVSPSHQWQPTDYPQVTANAYIDEDGGETVTGTLDLPFTQSDSMAQRIAKIALEQNRHQRQLSFPANLVGFQLAAGETVAVDLPRFGLADMPCTISEWQMSDDLGIDLTLDEDSADIYAFSVTDLQTLDGSPTVVAPNNASIPPTTPSNITATAGTEIITIGWNQIRDRDFRYVELWEYDENTDDPEHDAARIMEVYGNSVTRNRLPGQETLYYWLRSVDSYGNKSDFAGPVEATTTGTQNIVLVLE